MILNELYELQDVRRQISGRTGLRMPWREPDGQIKRKAEPREMSYDVELAFLGGAEKTKLAAGTKLVRLDYPVIFVMRLFMNVWWMRREILDAMADRANGSARSVRQEWQNQMALSKSAKGLRTQVVEIVLTAEVYAWVGIAAPLNHKQGGLEQIYLPNLAHGAGPSQSDYARLSSTGVLPPF